MYSHCGMLRRRRYEISFPLQTDSTLQLNSRLKYQTKSGGGTRDESLRASAWVARKRAKRKRGRKKRAGTGLPRAYYFRVPFLFAPTLLPKSLEQAKFIDTVETANGALREKLLNEMAT